MAASWSSLQVNCCLPLHFFCFLFLFLRLSFVVFFFSSFRCSSSLVGVFVSLLRIIFFLSGSCLPLPFPLLPNFLPVPVLVFLFLSSFPALYLSSSYSWSLSFCISRSSFSLFLLVVVLLLFLLVFLLRILLVVLLVTSFAFSCLSPSSHHTPYSLFLSFYFFINFFFFLFLLALVVVLLVDDLTLALCLVLFLVLFFLRALRFFFLLRLLFIIVLIFAVYFVFLHLHPLFPHDVLRSSSSFPTFPS